MRYAGNLAAVAARERFPARVLTEADGELWLVQLAALPRSLHLTHQTNLDVLRLDDRVSTGRISVTARRDPDPLLETCGALADAVYDWWGGAPPPIVYRSRSMPEVGRSVAFTENAMSTVLTARPLREATALHVYLVLRAGFAVPDEWLG